MYAVNLSSGNDLRTATYEKNPEDLRKDPAMFINNLSNRIGELNAEIGKLRQENHNIVAVFNRNVQGTNQNMNQLTTSINNMQQDNKNILSQLNLQIQHVHSLTQMATQGTQEFQNIHKRLATLDEKLDDLKFLLRK